VTEAEQAFRRARVVPIVTVQEVEPALAVIAALIEGGATLIEIVLRTAGAPGALAACRRRFPGMVLAAGTVLDAGRLATSIEFGADLVVSPGFDAGLVAAAQKSGIPIVPGVQTASEVMAARAAGCRLLKFYPAEPGNARAVLADFVYVFPDVTFVPTGKIHAGVLADYARLPNVAAVGGSWMQAGRASPAEISAAMREALAAMGHSSIAAENGPS